MTREESKHYLQQKRLPPPTSSSPLAFYKKQDVVYRAYQQYASYWLTKMDIPQTILDLRDQSKWGDTLSLGGL
eukprot:CAMPEP_0116836668 /NCGR_PEP_ID=MMETSP0418-20121206/8227_1 /TAXON_ID=1158023 /ORGANISM="Astrosyne radiata, Strain 13vi08-1A" /LENGTH=72 /DNA_ID=CAMNT_0004466469 /DNA_START=198 /DNA_END=416 /DNA_ORIENTATION=+